ncbi:hypothetical protein [Halorhabdus sp. BNX81]|uniref:EMC6-like membrane protein n=1 Tax=Halorhabdus sp. BNX81 TaxID=2980181 RepID=UPI0023DD1BA3|nr:hypothetical protein [Halorhabdus sp. BNX81]WEL21318.1 putative membrane protein [Halorhabdus sp. BNX81]
MATETSHRLTGHARSVTVTALSTIGGVIAGVASHMLFTVAESQSALGLVIAAAVAQFPILYAVGIDLDDFSAKDYLYVGFMTFSLWFVTWSILLTTA